MDENPYKAPAERGYPVERKAPFITRQDVMAAGLGVLAALILVLIFGAWEFFSSCLIPAHPARHSFQGFSLTGWQQRRCWDTTRLGTRLHSAMPADYRRRVSPRLPFLAKRPINNGDNSLATSPVAGFHRSDAGDVR